MAYFPPDILAVDVFIGMLANVNPGYDLCVICNHMMSSSLAFVVVTKCKSTDCVVICKTRSVMILQIYDSIKLSMFVVKLCIC